MCWVCCVLGDWKRMWSSQARRPARICCVDFINIHIHKMCKQAFEAYEILTSGPGLGSFCSSLIRLPFKPRETSFQWKYPFLKVGGGDPENPASFDVLIANNSGTNYSKGRRKTSSQALSSFFDLYLFCSVISKSVLQSFVLLSSHCC